MEIRFVISTRSYGSIDYVVVNLSGNNEEMVDKTREIIKKNIDMKKYKIE